MGSRGPAKTPTKLRVLHGARKRDLNQSEPKPRADVPTKPVGMSPAAEAVWDQVLRDWGETKVILAVDARALRVYCEAVVRYEVYAPQLEATGPLIRGAKRGAELVRNPLHQIVRDTADLVIKAARELGLTPAARANLHTGEFAPSDPLDAWEEEKTP